MNHQLASFLTKHGSIDLFDTGLLITFKGLEPIYLGGELIVHFDLYLTYLEMRSKGLARSFTGDIVRKLPPRGDTVEIAGSFSISAINSRKYEVRAVSSLGLEQRFFVTRSFLNDLSEAVKHWFDSMHDSDLIEAYRHGKDWWHIAGEIKGTPLLYRINRHSFLIEVPQTFDGEERFYVFSAESEDYDFWMETVQKSRTLLEENWLDGSWFEVLAADDKRTRIELQQGQIYLSLYDPKLAELNVCLGSDFRTLGTIRRILKAAWREEAELSCMEELFIDMDDDD